MSDAPNSQWADVVSVDKLIHEPARLAILAILSVADKADFLYLQNETGLTKGNLSSHLARLEDAEYIVIEKMFEGKTPRTVCRLTRNGEDAFREYAQRMKGMLDGLPE